VGKGFLNHRGGGEKSKRKQRYRTINERGGLWKGDKKNLPRGRIYYQMLIGVGFSGQKIGGMQHPLGSEKKVTKGFLKRKGTS